MSNREAAYVESGWRLSHIERNSLEATDHGNKSRSALRAEHTHGD